MHKIVHGAVLLHIIVAIVVVVGLIFGVSAIRNHVGLGASENTVYCSSDGTLGEVQPIQSHRSYCIKSNLSTLNPKPNMPVTLTFSIVDDEGNTLKDFQIMHDMLLHLIIVRKDLNSFQHLHPDFNAQTGELTLQGLTFPSSGPYRIFADFTPSSAQMGAGGMPLPVTISEDVTVAGSYSPQTIGEMTLTKAVDGYEVSLATNTAPATGEMTILSFSIKKDGKVVTNLENYLAALGHSVVLKENTLEYIHAHAVQEPTANQTGTIDFHVGFPFAGNYKVFTQFKHEGQVHTVEFVVPVTGEEVPTMPEEMDHSEHMPSL